MGSLISSPKVPAIPVPEAPPPIAAPATSANAQATQAGANQRIRAAAAGSTVGDSGAAGITKSAKTAGATLLGE